MLRRIIFCSAFTVSFCLGNADAESAIDAAVAPAATPAGTPVASQRFALCNDGNFRDRDDICALPMELALLSTAGQAGSVVYVEYSDHFWKSDSAQAAAMQQSATVNTANTWGGFDRSVFFDAHSGNNVNLAAVDHLTTAINRSSASSPLIITAATLTGSASDDGLPNPPGALTHAWSKASGPGMVNFANPNAASTTASFSAAGSSTLQPLATDSALSERDTVTITASTASPAGQYIYAAQNDGTIRVYNINSAHALVKTLTFFFGRCDVRGIAAATPTHRIYTMFNSGGQGHVACIDLLTDRVLWDHVIHPAVDRGDVTPDGKTLYVPSYEGLSNSPYEFVVNAISGNVISTIAMPIKTHDTICSLDGTKVFMENKSPDARIRTLSTANNQIITITDKFSGIVQPFAVNSKNTFVIADVIGVYGFQYADLTTGQILGTAVFNGTTWNDPGVTHPHGIGMTPNEAEAWVCDRGTGNHFVHVFKISSLPPVQKRLVTISNDNPHWLTFTIDGLYCYVAGEKGKNQATDVVDTTIYRRIGSLGPSEDLLEVDFNNGQVTATGSQFGVGRVR
jgi:WD40 repeat protein